MNNEKFFVATDVGGTFTDTVVVTSTGKTFLGKALSTPPDYENGVINSIISAAESMELDLQQLLGQTELFLHGSTVVDNTVLTRDGAKTGLITTEGFEDTIMVTRGAYGRWSGLTEEGIKNPVHTNRAQPLVESESIVGVKERVDFEGDIIEPLDMDGVRRAVKHLLDKNVEAIAVSLLWSSSNSAHEQAIRDCIAELAPDVHVTISSDIAPVPGEYERTSTSVINAYAGPVTQSYLQGLEEKLNINGYKGQTMVMQGYGGLIPSGEASKRAIGMVESGPAAGVIGAKALGDTMENPNVIAADMGGTTFKVGIIQDGEISYSKEPMVDRFHYITPKMDVVSISIAGGSIIRLDPQFGIPTIGPDSAGSRPGPVCYGLGGKLPTITDVMLLIGYMDEKFRLNKTMELDVENTRRVFREQIADPLGVSVEEAAIGIYRVAVAQITDLIHKITVERGLDPRDFVLQSFGGSCGFIASAFGQELGVQKLVIPYTASVNCAFGLAMADVRHEYTTAVKLTDRANPEELNLIFSPMIEAANKQLKSEGFTDDKIEMTWSVDLRYKRQVHEVTTTVNAPTPLDRNGLERLIADFERLYESNYGKGSAYREAGIEMTMGRLTATGKIERPNLTPVELGSSDASEALVEQRPILDFSKEKIVTGDIYDFEKLKPGNRFHGPAIIHTPITTISVQGNQTAYMDSYSNIIIETED